MFAGWQLVIVNSGYLSYKRALGLRPAGQGGDTVPFGVSGNRIFIHCLGDNAQVTPGYGTYTWTATATTLKLHVVHDACPNADRRNYIATLTSETWRKSR
jgi:hypothetical protein